MGTEYLDKAERALEVGTKIAAMKTPMIALLGGLGVVPLVHPGIAS